jgi:hypothetical protein
LLKGFPCVTRARDLLTCLLEIDQALAKGDLRYARALMTGAEDSALQLQQEILTTLREKENLQRRLLELTNALPPPQPPRSSNVIAMPLRAAGASQR